VIKGEETDTNNTVEGRFIKNDDRKKRLRERVEIRQVDGI